MNSNQAPALDRSTRLSYVSSEDGLLKRAIIRLVERLTGQVEIERLYHQVLDRAQSDQLIWEEAIRSLDLDLRYDRSRLDAVPRDRPVVFVANHPFGVLDGLVISYLVSCVRPRFRVLTNSALCFDNRVQDYLLPIDFDPTAAAQRSNIDTKRRALEALADGEAVVIFPSGAVATARSWFGPALEEEWKTFAAKMIHQAKATVVPIYFHGQNSRIFQIFSQLSMTLRLGILLGELHRRIGSTVEISIGHPIPWTELETIKGRAALTEYLQRATHAIEP